ncbi:DUF4384 domain-containing protein [Bradyrhizobium prioriisuperbiae]|uniref:DUF4384 domain-containing protein n=1 Tax=Bradyrhizobium prioriisuperbiae TaxID=2854389 RepID=UPI0028E3D6D3|nr:DUF4384 domain-containing protein [Bradyrhizobium prioritasuperba]
MRLFRPVGVVSFCLAVTASAVAWAQNANPASVTLRMMPEKSVDIGTKVSFRVSTKKAGYLLLLDVDADGKMSQIFPSPELLARSAGKDINFVKAGDELQVPTAAAKQQGFEYVITPPTGTATVVAILSERRVQILDLPDLPKKLQTQADAVTYLATWTSELRIPDSDSGKLLQNSWSFDVKQYSIQ